MQPVDEPESTFSVTNHHNERIWTTGVINKMLFLTEIEFIDVRNVAKGFIPERYSETMVILKGGDCRPTKRRGTKSRQQRDESIKCKPLKDKSPFSFMFLILIKTEHEQTIKNRVYGGLVS